MGHRIRQLNITKKLFPKYRNCKQSFYFVVVFCLSIILRNWEAISRIVKGFWMNPTQPRLIILLACPFKL